MSGCVSATVRIGDDVAWTIGVSRVVAMDLARPGATPYVLEESAAAVWEEIAETGPVTGEALTLAIASAFAADSTEIADDVEALIADLVARDLLVCEDRLVVDTRTVR
ncbi:PqqD family protein [Microbacterium profundi]